MFNIQPSSTSASYNFGITNSTSPLMPFTPAISTQLTPIQTSQDVLNRDNLDTHNIAQVVPIKFENLPLDVIRLILCEKQIDREMLIVCMFVNKFFKKIVCPQIKKWSFSEWSNPKHFCLVASKKGYLPLIQWARANKAPWDTKRLGSAAATYGHLELLQWVYSQGGKFHAGVCAWAAKGGFLNILKWARTVDLPWDDLVCCWAAANGHLELLKWARANGAPWEGRVVTFAAENGQLEVIKWLTTLNEPWNPSSSVLAAQNGHLHVLEWIHANVEHEHFKDFRITSRAAKNGHLNVLQWAHSNNIPLSPKILANACIHGHPHILAWAKKIGLHLKPHHESILQASKQKEIKDTNLP